MRVLLLGGTAEARALATALVGDGLDVTTSLAGAVANPRLPAGQVRIGGFGGVSGMVTYLRDHHITHVVDATHPFAATMTAHAAAACAETSTPLVRLSRPGWGDHPGASEWQWVDSLDEARVVAEGVGDRAFLAIGRQGVRPFLVWSDRYALLRVVDSPDVAVPRSWEVLRARGPFALDDERALLVDRRINVLVTKDSGGKQGAAKLDACADLGVPVVIVRQPPLPQDLHIASTAAQVLEWIST